VRVPAGLYKRGSMLVDALHDAQCKQLRNIGVMTDAAPLKVTLELPLPAEWV